VAQASFGALLASLLRHCPYDLQCRGRICRVQLLRAIDDERQNYPLCFEPPTVPSIEFVPRIYLDRQRPTSVQVGVPVRDPLSGASFYRIDLPYRLASLTGEPTDAPNLPFVGTFAPGRHHPWAPVPASRSVVCRAEVAILRARLEAVERMVDERSPPELVFQSN